MDCHQHATALLTRSKSSLLRSSPTVRSSIHSLSSVAEDHLIDDGDDEEDVDKMMMMKKKKKKGRPTRGSLAGRVLSIRFGPAAAVSALAFSTAFYVSFFCWRKEVMPSSENLLISLIFIAVVLYFISRNRLLVDRDLSILKSLCIAKAKRLSLSRGCSKSVQWYIGDSKGESDAVAVEGKMRKKIIREGVEFYSNGDFYEGEFHKGRCNGSGVYNYFAKGRYEGDWVDGKYDGYGIESWARGSKYRGQYRNGLRHGYGAYRFFTGDSYSGEWWNGQSHGVGVQSCKDGSCFVGEFKCGVKHGSGCYYFRNGDKYAGEYFNDKMHGFGVYQFANGHCYEGSWHEGCKQGYGLYTFRSGVTKCGEWDLGNLKNPIPPLTDALVRVIQASRKFAENAIHLRRVDEQVNKAVLAASRAATAARVAAIRAVQNRMDGKFCDTES
ncbi:hypothetical protein MLD38_033995 [Melastoma candidum]|uniref:Uncharacterized protein n=1 Tax=Melastoma candidum TaxID=119954 RepID=A0ACB9MAU3_9MYRT|nr:hypothetical protein MLD38_033995 [Melastoma candidum]